MKLAMVAGRLHAAQAGLSLAQATDRQQRDQVRADLEGQLSGAELHGADWLQRAAAAREARMEADVEAARVAHLAQCQALLERTRERKTLDTLESNHRAAQQREQARREQAQQDEAFLRLKIDRS